MLKKILIGCAAIVIAVLVIAAMQSSEFNFSRSATMNGAASEAFAQVNDLHKMDVWSPWLKPDPQAKKTFAGPEAGEGASFAWEGNDEVGAGKMTIVESVPNERVRLKMEFLKPFESTAEVLFEFKTEGGQTTVTQTMSGQKIFISKLIGMFIDMDKMMGSQFEKGFAAMKQIVESASQTTESNMPESRDIVIERIFDASIEKVWQAWSSPESMKLWWGPKNYTAPTAKIDFREGGKYLVSMRSPEGQEFWSTGTYLKIIPQRLIEAEDSFADANGNVVPAAYYGMPEDFPMKTFLSLKFEKDGDAKTKFTLIHRGTPTGGIADLTKTGWNESFDKLAASLTAR